MSISISGRKKPLQTKEDVQDFGVQLDIAEYDSKQFLNEYGTRIVQMLRDQTRRTYSNNSGGANLLLTHIKSPETDATAWGPTHTPTDSVGQKLPKKKKETIDITKTFLAKDDLSEEEFNRLRQTGMLSATKIYFSQLRCSPGFQLPIVLGGLRCTDIDELTAALKKDPGLAAQFDPPITIIWYEDKVTSVDNRRLKAHREAGVDIRYQKKRWRQLTLNEKGHFDEGAPAENINVT